MSDRDPKSKTARHVQFGVLFVVSTLVVGIILFFAIEFWWRQSFADLAPIDITPGVGLFLLFWWMIGAVVSPVIGFLLATIICHLFAARKRKRKDDVSH